MLKLKHSLHFPKISFDSHPPLELAPIQIDDDELSQAIMNDPVDHDDNWTLEERPDTQELESFWSQVTDDLKKDPDWVDFGHENAS